MSVTITFTPNPLQPEQRIVHPFDYMGRSLSDYITLDDSARYVIVHNGEYNLDPVIKDGDVVSVCAEVRATVAAGVASWAAGGSFSALFAAGYYGAAALYAVYFVGTLFAIGAGMSQLMSMLNNQPDYTDPNRGQTYGWGNISQSDLEGNAMQVVYGTVRTGGQTINQFTRTYRVFDSDQYDGVDISSVERVVDWQYYGAYDKDLWPDRIDWPGVWVFSLTNGETISVPNSWGLSDSSVMADVLAYIESKQSTASSEDEEYLHMLNAVAGHEVDEITDIRVNDQRSDYYDNITTHTRLGELEQDPIPQFGDLVTQNDFQYKLEKDNAVTYTTSGDAVEQLNIVVTMPNGCGYVNDDGTYAERTVQCLVRYQISGSGSWTTFSADGSDTCNVKGAQAESITATWVITDLTPGEYDVEITRVTDDSDSSRERTDIYWIGLQEVVKEELEYPGVALYGIIGLATNQLSGAIPRTTALVTRSTVSVYNEDTTSWESKSASNPAWICYDILRSHGGVVYTRLVWDEFKAWADYCDDDIDGSPRHQIGVIFDTLSDLWTEVQRIAGIARAKVVPRGTSFGAFIDKAETTISHIFGMGNIIRDTYTLQYLPKIDAANYVEITYQDPDRDYTQQSIGVFNSDYLDSGIEAKKTSLQVKASIPRAQAIRMANYTLNSNLLMKKAIEFEASVEAATCVVGDLFPFQHESTDPSRGCSGRLISATSNTAGLDRSFDFQVGEDYSITVRHTSTGVIETKAITNPGTAASSVTLTGTWTTTPAAGDVYEVSETVKHIYRVTNVQRVNDQTVRITGVNYDADVYDDTSVVISEPPDTDFPYREPDQFALNVKAREVVQLTPSGDYQSVVSVTWNSGTKFPKQPWALWVKNITTEGWYGDGFVSNGDGQWNGNVETSKPRYVGSTGALSYIIPADYFSSGSTYRIFVVPEDGGAVNTGGNTAVIQILGKDAPPADVTTFSVSFDPTSRRVTWAWSPVADVDLAGYEIRLGSAWDTGETVITKDRGQGTSHEQILTEDVSAGTYYWTIKAVDTSGNYSVNAAGASEYIDVDDVGDGVDVVTSLALSTTSGLGPDGTTLTYILASWDDTPASSAFFLKYELELEDILIGKKSRASTPENTYQFLVQPNRSYGVRVRSVDQSGNATAYCSQETITSAKDTDAPATPTWPASGAITAGFKVIGLDWNDNTETDLSHYTIQRSTDAGFTSPVTIGTKRGSFTTDTELAVSTQYWYRIKAVDTSGNESGWSASQNTTTLQVGESDIAANAITASKINVTALSAISADCGTITAGVIQNASGETYLDFDNTLIEWADALSFNGTTLYLADDVVIGGTGSSSDIEIKTNTSTIDIGSTSGKITFGGDSDTKIYGQSGIVYIETGNASLGVLDGGTLNKVSMQLYDPTGSYQYGAVEIDDDDVGIYAYDNLYLEAASSSSFIQFTLNSNAWRLTDAASGTQTIFQPYSGSSTSYIGTSGAPFDYIHGGAVYDSVGQLDDVFDDLELLRQIKPKKDKDGNNIVHPAGGEIIDLLSLPEFLTNKAELRREIMSENGGLISDSEFDEMIRNDEELGWRLKRNVGRFGDLTNGAIRQLDQEVDEIVEQLNALIEDLTCRTKSLQMN